VSPRTAGEWLALLPQVLGAAMVVFCLVFWAITDRVEPLFLTTGAGLLTVGIGAGAIAALRSPEPPQVPSAAPPPPSPPPV
jgi:hypothetical protein